MASVCPIGSPPAIEAFGRTNPRSLGSKTPVRFQGSHASENSVRANAAAGHHAALREWLRERPRFNASPRVKAPTLLLRMATAFEKQDRFVYIVPEGLA
jgi:hypothetical protein